MGDFLINALSARNQCKSHEDSADVLLNIVDCFKLISPGIRSGTHSLMIDERIQNTEIFNGQTLHAVFSSIGKNNKLADAKKLWFLYTRKAKKANVEGVEIEVNYHPRNNESYVVGEGSVDMLSDLILISLGGNHLMTQAQLALVSGERQRVAQNVYDLKSIRRIVPIYEASNKHRTERYYDHIRKETVAPMTLPPDIAQDVLSSAIFIHGDYFGIHDFTGKIIRFKKTLNNVYHGFEVDKSELSNSLLSLLGLK